MNNAVLSSRIHTPSGIQVGDAVVEVSCHAFTYFFFILHILLIPGRRRQCRWRQHRVVHRLNPRRTRYAHSHALHTDHEQMFHCRKHSHVEVPKKVKGPAGTRNDRERCCADSGWYCYVTKSLQKVVKGRLIYSLKRGLMRMLLSAADMQL